MDETETKIEKLARLSGKVASKALGALERRGYDIRGTLSAPIGRVPRRDPPKPKPDNSTAAATETPVDPTIEEATAPGRQRAAQPTIGGSVYLKPQEIAWEPTQFAGISIKVLYEDKAKGEMTCLLRWEPGATLPMHQHPEIEQTYVVEGSFYDHDGICRAGEFVWRRVGSFHETHSDEGAIILAIYRKPNVFQHTVVGRLGGCRLFLVRRQPRIHAAVDRRPGLARGRKRRRDRRGIGNSWGLNITVPDGNAPLIVITGYAGAPRSIPTRPGAPGPRRRRLVQRKSCSVCAPAGMTGPPGQTIRR